MSKYTRRPLLGEEICVHVMSRVVQKRFLIDEQGMAEMRRILRTQAEFAGMEVITFCFLKNHFHILLHVDPEEARMNVPDGELMRRFRALYGTKRSPSLGANAEELEDVLKRNMERAEEARRRLKARMGDISVFMRELKTRFTFWYNEHYKTVGTFWAERFRSVLVEPGSLALKAVAAYIDLNAVRAGLAETPQSYRFCGLGEAATGRARARAAYQWLVRRRKGRNSETKTDVFEEYAAYVNRILNCLHRERTAAEREAARIAGEDPGPGGMAVEEAAAVYGYAVKGGAVGSKGWVEHQREQSAGLFGFLRKGKAKAIFVGSETGLYAARGWRSGD